MRAGRVLVAKYQLSPGNYLAMFAGGGVALADTLIKEHAGFELADDDGGAPDLAGLSCRWEPHRSLRGRMLTFLVRARDREGLAVYREIIARLGAILGEASAAAAPILPANTRFRWPPKGLAAEALLTHGRLPRWLWRAYLTLETLLQLIAERLNLKIGTYDPPAYRAELRRNSDHRKAADTLQMVLDCTPAEIAAIEAYLAELHAAGRIVYGTHLADGAMMTCMVFSLEESRHVHFIDGADGGYALAALQLKAQLQALAGQPWDKTLAARTACDRRRRERARAAARTSARAALRATPAAG